MKKRLLSLAFSCIFLLALAVPALAVEDITITMDDAYEENQPLHKCYVIPDVVDIKTYPIDRTVLDPGDDDSRWVFGLGNAQQVTVYVVKVGTRIDLSGLSHWMVNAPLGLKDGVLQLLDEDIDWTKAVEYSDTSADSGFANGSYIKFLSTGFYAFNAYPYPETPIDPDAAAASILYVSDDGSSPAVPEVPATIPPSTCAVTVDGKPVTLNAYMVSNAKGNGTNYVMLRDVAYLLNGTPAQFEVHWSAESGIWLDCNTPYTPVGGELQSKGIDAKAYTHMVSEISLNRGTLIGGGDTWRVTLDTYTIEGNNYFKLRDLGAALGFNVGWDGATGTVTMDSTQPYSGTN